MLTLVDIAKLPSKIISLFLYRPTAAYRKDVKFFINFPFYCLSTLNCLNYYKYNMK